MAAHHGHALALRDGSATAAMDCMFPAGPVHLASYSLLPLVEEGLVHQEGTPIACLQELKRPIPYCRKDPEKSPHQGQESGVSGGTAMYFLPNVGIFP